MKLLRTRRGNGSAERSGFAPVWKAHTLMTEVRGRAFTLSKRVRRGMPLHRPQRPLVVFVAGVHRSGTNMLMQVLDASLQTEVFGESDRRAFDHYLMRDETVIEALVGRSHAETVAVKALHEAHKLRHLLDRFAPAKAIWPVRRFSDVVNSIAHRWPNWRNELDEIAADRTAGGWRALGMTDATHRLIKDSYREDMDDASALALFWYYRNQLFFDQGFATDGRVLPIAYEALVRDPQASVAQIAAFAGIDATDRMWRIPHADSVGKDAPRPLLRDIRALCDDMQKRLDEACGRHAVRAVPIFIPHRHDVRQRARAIPESAAKQ
jgi:Sulfotransferase domain